MFKWCISNMYPTQLFARNNNLENNLVFEKDEFDSLKQMKNLANVCNTT